VYIATYSGRVACRCNFKAYCIFSFLNTIVYCIPAGWAWGDHGFLNRLGYVDIAGSGPVHLIGGSSGEFFHVRAKLSLSNIMAVISSNK
jgi:ammonia channel protein AmtB